MTLYTKIRPKTFDEVKGQEFTVNNLRMQSIRDKFFQVIILAGQYGAGKTTLARIVATAANCKNKDKDLCEIRISALNDVVITKCAYYERKD